MAEDLAFKYKSATVRTGCATKTYECGSDSVVYSWSAAMDSAGLFSDEGLYCGDSIKCYHPLQVRGACPVGWHLPNLNEWKTLFTATSSKTWKRLNEFGFAFIYSIYKEPSMKVNPYWTSTEENLSNGKTNVNIINLEKEFEGASIRLSGTSWHNYLYAIRCVKDVESHKSDYKPTYIIDERDNQHYRTVKIGKQNWMAQDLYYNSEEKSSSKDPLAKRGRFGYNYTWAGAVDSLGLFSKNAKGCGNFTDCKFDKSIRGLCPKGWHLSDSTEWAELFDFIKKDRQGHSITSDGANSFITTFQTARMAKFWTATQHSPYTGISVVIETGDAGENVFFSRYDKDLLFGIRCIED